MRNERNDQVHSAAWLFRTADSLRADSAALTSAAVDTYNGSPDEITIVSYSLLDLAIGAFLDLNDGGRDKVDNPEYYRAGFELIRQTFVHGDFYHAQGWLADRIAAHPNWVGGSEVIPD